MATSRIKTTVVGSYPMPDWLLALPSEQALLDATRVIIHLQEQAGIDLVCDGELYRFDVNHPETNGMIEYFVKPMAGVRSGITFEELVIYRDQPATRFRAHPPAVVGVGAGELELLGRAVVCSVRADAQFTMVTGDDRVDEGKSEAGSGCTAGGVGATEPVGGAKQVVRGHAGAAIDNFQHDVLARRDAIVAYTRCVERFIARADNDLATISHGIASIDDQVEHGILELARIDFDRTDLGVELAAQFDFTGQCAPQQFVHSAE